MAHTISTLPPGLRAIAAAWILTPPATKTGQQAAIRGADDRGGLTLDAARRACLDAADHGRAMRRARRERQWIDGLGYCPVDPARHRGAASIHRLASWASDRAAACDYRCTAADLRTPTHGTPAGRIVRLPAGTPASRLDAARRASIESIYLATYRQAAHGDITATLTDDPAAVGLAQNTYNDWDGYAASCKYPMRRQDTIIIAPRDWRVRVERRGLALLDGMLTLDAAPMDSTPAGVDLYAACWIIQGRGTSTEAVRGYIARSGEYTYHADTAAAALSGLGRKLKRQRLDADFAAALAASSVPDLAARAPADAVVRIADARAVGACEYGIKSWCYSTGLPYEAGSAPLADVVAAWQREPRAEARGAILHALRRYRGSIMQAAA